MEAYLDDVKKYDDSELRQKLKEFGISVGPITQGTRLVLQKRLAAKQLEKSTGLTLEKDDTSDESTCNEQATTERKSSDSDVFYAICLPENADQVVSQEVTQLVFSDKNLALKTAKMVKGSRFKVFKSESDAEMFSRLTADCVFQSPKKLQKEDLQASSESSPYKGPKPQEVVVLRRILESGDISAFKECVWQNPRYLVSSGDTPVMFQEGPRYTAMHIAALKNKPEMCRVILDTLEDVKFMNKLYCNNMNTMETQNNRINFLVDLYLNMPDKGNCESPLHMACKFGYDRVVEVLAAHPKTDKTMKNKWGETPKDLICSRVPNSPASLKTRIEDLLKGQYYVPLIRSDDNSAPPVVGQPWSPDVKKSPLDSPKVSWSPKDPNMSIRACAGPMSPDDANKFHKRWITPPSQNRDQTKEYFNTKRSDSEKGMERIGRKLAHELGLPWKEHWEFLQDFIDISSPTGLDALEEYLTKKQWLIFIKNFKDKFGIHESDSVCDEVATPVANRSVERELKKADQAVLDVGETKTETQEKSDSECCTGTDVGETKTETQKKSDSEHCNGTDVVKTKTETQGKSDSEHCNGTDVGETKTETQEKSDSEHCNGTDVGETKTETQEKSDSEHCKGTDVVETKTETQEKSDSEHCNLNYVSESTSVSDSIVSPVTGLLQSFAKLKLDDSLIDQSMVNTSFNSKHSDVAVDERHIQGNKNLSQSVENTVVQDNMKDAPESDEQKTNEIINGSLNNVGDKRNKQKENEDVKDSNSCEIDGAKGSDSKTTQKEIDSKAKGTGEQVSHIRTDPHSPYNGTSDSERKKTTLQILVSEGSESVSSYETALDEEQDSSLSFVSDSSDLGLVPVCINIKDREVFNEIKNSLCNKEEEHLISSNEIRLLVRMVPVNNGKNITVDIVSIPNIETVKELKLYEGVEVSSCTGDLGSVLDGEEVDLGVEAGATEEKVVHTVQAYLTRATTLPKTGYIHGPQPTREDLDVCRALSDCVIAPTSHPKVFSWKLSMAKFLKDSNFKWQSPAKLKSSLHQASLQPFAMQGTSPVISYGSPLGLSARPSRDIGNSDVRIRLFPSIQE